MNIGPIDALFDAEVTGMDLCRLLRDDTRTTINAAFVENGVLGFRDQNFQVRISSSPPPLIWGPPCRRWLPLTAWRVTTRLSN